MNKKRKLKPGVEMPIRIARIFAIIMQVGIFVWAFTTFAIAASLDNVQWHDVVAPFIHLLGFLFWSWVHNFANELLELA